ncbi:hypothetical protein P7K49_034376 [Saguinus oedipus]|uniref:DUF5577 domain-containing protein n=1 Tax=Saguinus oedipus TaxID=9490 RepID=A0ABQ9TUK9_SAGOE|nr:hypothetical protein P7K49_034376 [Saguinus oedipus]
MLLDLNKEIMNELGVTVVGDIIAILKHAKVVHRQDPDGNLADNLDIPVSIVTSLPGSLRVAFSHSPDASVAVATYQIVYVPLSTRPVCDSAVVTQVPVLFLQDMCKAATESVPSSPSPLAGEIRRGTTSAASRMITNSLNCDSPPNTPPRRPDTSTSKISVTVSNKMAAKSAKATGEGTWAALARLEEESVAVPAKRRRVTAEMEGKYVINMPKGTTPRTRKILEQQQAAKGTGPSGYASLQRLCPSRCITQGPSYPTDGGREVGSNRGYRRLRSRGHQWWPQRRETQYLCPLILQLV